MASNPREPRLAAEVPPEEIAEKTGLAWPHTSHCLGDGTIMVSFMGEAKTGNARGGFAIFDEEMRFKCSWEKEASPFGCASRCACCCCAAAMHHYRRAWWPRMLRHHNLRSLGVIISRACLMVNEEELINHRGPY